MRRKMKRSVIVVLTWGEWLFDLVGLTGQTRQLRTARVRLECGCLKAAIGHLPAEKNVVIAIES